MVEKGRFHFGRLVCCLAACLLAFAVVVRPAPAVENTLESIQTSVADDGSAIFRLKFSGLAPEAHLVRSGEETVHLVLIATRRGRNLSERIGKVGPVVSAHIMTFAAVGLRIDFTLNEPVKMRTQAEGNELLVHVPSIKGDDEAKIAAVAAVERQKNEAALGPNAIRTVVVPLNFAEISEVAGLLVKGAVIPSVDTFRAQSPFSATPPPSSSSYSSASSAQAAAPSYVTIPTAAILPSPTPEGVRFDEHVAVDRRLNAIILTGTSAQIADYKRIIADVDIPTRSVVLETQIVELTQTAAHNLGIDFSPNGQLASATFNAAAGGHPSAAAAFRANLYAEEQRGTAKVLAKPRILALNGEPAAILSGEAVPIFNTVTIPSGGSAIVQQQIQYINVGVSLEILPRIADDGRVTAHVFSEVSTILGYTGNAPQIAVRQELTSAIVTDGDALVIGGLLQENEITTLGKIPGLGDIPILGQLFHFETKSSRTTNLYVIITPHVLSNRVVPPTRKPAKPH